MSGRHIGGIKFPHRLFRHWAELCTNRPDAEIAPFSLERTS